MIAGLDAVGVGERPRCRRAAAGHDQRVPQPGPGLARVAAVVGAVGELRTSRGEPAAGRVATAGPGLTGGLGAASGNSTALSHAASSTVPRPREPDPADAVLGDRQEAASGARRAPRAPAAARRDAPRRRGRAAPRRTSPASRQVGGVVVAGLVEQHPLSGAAEIGVDRQPVHRGTTHLRLGPGDRCRPRAPRPSRPGPP